MNTLFSIFTRWSLVGRCFQFDVRVMPREFVFKASHTCVLMVATARFARPAVQVLCHTEKDPQQRIQLRRHVDNKFV